MHEHGHMWREHVLLWLLHLHLSLVSLIDILSANFIVFTISVNIWSAGVVSTEQMLVQFPKNCKFIFLFPLLNDALIW